MKSRFDNRLAICMVIAVLTCVIVLAAPVTALKVVGSIYKGTASPGQTVVFPITISTSGGDPSLDMVVDVMGFGQGPDKSYVALAPVSDTSPYSARGFIAIDTPTFHLDPGASKTITATISVPKDAVPGGRYAIISIHSLPTGSGSALVVAAINVPVMMTLNSPGSTPAGMITNVKTGDIVTGQPFTITSSFKNTGNIHYAGTVNNVQVADSTGKPVAQLSTDPTLYSIIPGNTVDFVVNLNSALSPGTYAVTSSISLGGQVLDSKTTTFDVKSNYVAPPKETSVKLTPQNSAVLASSDGRITISFPAGAVLSDVTVTLKPFSLDQLPGLPADSKAAGTCFEVDGLTGLLSKDATVNVKYSSSDLDTAGGDTSKLVLARYDQADGQWSKLQTSLSSDTTTLSATTNRFSTWAVLATSTPAAQGTTSAGGKTGGFLGGILAPDITTVLLSLGLMVVIFGMWKRKKD
jgi:hypothetical protein